MFKSKNKNQLLQQDLINFGLNPDDWILEYIESLRYLLRPKNQDTFNLYGRIHFKNNRPSWQSIDMLEL